MDDTKLGGLRRYGHRLFFRGVVGSVRVLLLEIDLFHHHAGVHRPHPARIHGRNSRHRRSKRLSVSERAGALISASPLSMIATCRLFTTCDCPLSGKLTSRCGSVYALRVPGAVSEPSRYLSDGVRPQSVIRFLNYPDVQRSAPVSKRPFVCEVECGLVGQSGGSRFAAIDCFRMTGTEQRARKV